MTRNEEAGQTSNRLLLRSAAAISAIALIVIVGYLGFLFYVVNIGVASPVTTIGVTLVAVIAGVATFFNPCSFPLLPSVVTRYRDSEKKGGPVQNGLIVGSGIVTFNVILGAAIGLAGAGVGLSLSLAQPDPPLAILLFRGAIGALLTGLGVMAIAGRGFHTLVGAKVGAWISSRREAGPRRGLFAYGFGYNALGIGCSAPIFAGLALFAFASGGFLTAIAAFLVFSLTMAALAVAISILSGASDRERVRGLTRSTSTFGKLAGGAQVAVGIFLVLSSIFVSAFVGFFFPV
jgi:cytochrome c-type biogenesis protein